MKKIILFGFLFIHLSKYNAQIWCTPSSVWHYDFVSGYSKHTYISDTLILGQIHNKIQIHDFGKGWGGHNDYRYIYTRINNNVVYLGPDTVFDLKANIGQQWRIRAFSNDTVPLRSCHSLVTVMDTGHLTIQGIWLKWLKVQVSRNQRSKFTGPDTIVERIGFLRSYAFGFDYDCYQAVDADLASDLRCFSDNKIPLYKYRYTGDCEYHVFTSLAERTGLDGSFLLYPNPAQGLVTIKFDQSDNYLLKLCDLTGVELKVIQITANNPVIDTRGMNNGIYIVKLFDRNHKPLARQKLIVSN